MYWVRDEYEKLAASERSQFGILFGCHKYRHRPPDEHEACAGWLMDQRKHNIPSIALRLQCITDPAANAAIETVHSGGRELYGSTAELCAVNLTAFDQAVANEINPVTCGECESHNHGRCRRHDLYTAPEYWCGLGRRRSAP